MGFPGALLCDVGVKLFVLMLRLKKLRRQHDPTSTSATEFVAQRTSEKTSRISWEPWMKELDQLLEDAALVESVYEAQGKRHPKSRTRGRLQTPSESGDGGRRSKHVRNWSYDMLEREVRSGTWCIGRSRASETRKCRTLKHWHGWDRRSGPE